MERIFAKVKVMPDADRCLCLNKLRKGAYILVMDEGPLGPGILHVTEKDEEFVRSEFVPMANIASIALDEEESEKLFGGYASPSPLPLEGEAVPATDDEVREAIAKLDPKDGFTGSGLPSVAGLEDILKGKSVSAEQRNQVWDKILDAKMTIG